MRTTLATTLFLALAGLAAACGGAPPAPAAPPAAEAATVTAATTAAPAVPAAVAGWKAAKSKDEQMAYMKTTIVPAMTPVFAKAKDFGCKSCHGPAYKDPHDFLPRLTLKDGKITAFAEKPEIAKYMAEKVVPAMATAMGMKPYDPATHQGFGCMGCHAVDMK